MLSPLSNRAVYLGEGVWWQLTERQVYAGFAGNLPTKFRPIPRDRKDHPHD